jgi:asparagine synthase (glutamine-hydrolysing)
MCGISGLANCGNRETLSRMNHVQFHRGPDDNGIWERRFSDGSYIGLGSRRLAILDLSADGHMPMCNEDGSVWITYNGEIYNFRELRCELEAKGHSFISDTDTEVIIHLYEEEGRDCVRRLNGMFAFAICDLRGAKPAVFVARDHFGIKPFYYAQRGHRFAFASEIKALLQVPGIQAELDVEALHQYLTFLWVPEPATMFRGVLKLPAGHYGVWQDGSFEITQFWDLTFADSDTKFCYSEAELADEVRARFERSVQAQMVSDVPVGAFLSAGLDSSSIVATMAKTARQPVRTYTVTFPEKYRRGENTLDDPQVAARLALRLGCEHRTITVEPDVTSLLGRLSWHMDEPIADPAIIAAYLVCREARDHATVMLSGVGGDELFGGYRKYYAQRWAEAYGRIPSTVRRWLESSLLRLPAFRGTAVKGDVRLIKKMARSASLPAVERFIMNCTYIDGLQKSALYTTDLRAELRGSTPEARHYACFEKVSGANFLNQMLYLDTKVFMPSLNLTYNDKMSMASSVEVRVPFLDRELAEFVAASVPPELKLKGFFRPMTKYLLRKAMSDVLPPEVLRQPKAGFAAPVDYWLAHDLKEMVGDLLSESQIRKRGLFHIDAVRTFVDEHRAGVHDWSMQVWQFLTLEIWMQNFLDVPASAPTMQSIDFQPAVPA